MRVNSFALYLVAYESLKLINGSILMLKSKTQNSFQLLALHK